MQDFDKSYDADAFYGAVVATVEARRKTWKQVSAETGVSATTLTRMAQGRRPDAASLAALSAWAGLNPADFVQGPRRDAEPLAKIGILLRSDPNLGPQAAKALEAMIKSAYQELRSDQDKGNQRK